MDNAVEQHIDRAMHALTQAKQAARFNLDRQISNALSAALPFNLQGSTEEKLIAAAQQALSECNWMIGECAARWHKTYARGRNDAEFGALIGLSGDQVLQRRRVWMEFSEVRARYSDINWSHFYVALNWDDAAECLQWAHDMSATVAEMKAWRRARHGEDLSEISE